MAIKQLAKEEQPRQKALKHGIETLNNHELIAVVIHTGTKEKSVIELAQEVLKRYDGLENLLNASIYELMSIAGIKEAKAVSIAAIIELAKRIQNLPRSDDKIQHPQDAFLLWKNKLKYEKQEKFILVCLDTKNKIIFSKVVFIGSLDTSIVHPREIFKEAIQSSSAKIICIHNHPSGDCTPSKEDIALTKQLDEAGKIVGITLLDHIIIGFDQFYSMKENGLF